MPLVTKMKLFDLHCDTATRLLGENQGLFENNLHISLNRSEYLENYAQVMAIWTNHKLTDEQGYERFFEVIENLDNEVLKNKDIVERVSSSNQLISCIDANKTPFILAVEDARILGNDISRLDVLYSHGVRLLTLNWYGETCIGGAHDTDIGLSDFGILTVKKCFDLGIIPDISHSSFKGAKITLELAKESNKPIVASHSDSYAINQHTRNLKDEDFQDICNLGGLVGINLCPAHLSSRNSADIHDIIKHIEHYLALGGENTLSMGGDLDGTNLPEGFSGIEDFYKISNEMQRLNYSDELIDKIMYKNAFEFFKRNL
jgi:membrane dipeptidase